MNSFSLKLGLHRGCNGNYQVKVINATFNLFVSGAGPLIQTESYVRFGWLIKSNGRKTTSPL